MIPGRLWQQAFALLLLSPSIGLAITTALWFSGLRLPRMVLNNAVALTLFALSSFIVLRCRVCCIPHSMRQMFTTGLCPTCEKRFPAEDEDDDE
jgi:hypothetical protein